MDDDVPLYIRSSITRNLNKIVPSLKILFSTKILILSINSVNDEKIAVEWFLVLT